MTQYDENFYDVIREGSLRSARVVVPHVVKLLHPKTVLDVGCGEGAWLSVFAEQGCEILGIDGDYVLGHLLIPSSNFFCRDLSSDWPVPERISSGKLVDLVTSLEVAEHLPSSVAGNFVRKLCSLSDTVLFSAAIPGQGGTNHINEQWGDYWAELFQAEGYAVSGALRWAFWNDARVENWYRQNLILCVKESVQLSFQMQQVMRGPLSPPWPVVHPILYDARR